MINSTFKKIINDTQQKILKLTKKNGWLWFYKMHQKEVINASKKLLKLYPKANKKIVLISSWLHDISKYYAKNTKDVPAVEKNHHIDSAKIAERFLRSYKLNEKEINQIRNCILRHRNKPPYRARTLEEKMMTVADTLSHFTSIFYLTYFKFYPEHSIEEMVKNNLAKLKRDWRDIQLLPKAKKLVEEEYKILKKLLENYQK